MSLVEIVEDEFQINMEEISTEHTVAVEFEVDTDQTNAEVVTLDFTEDAENGTEIDQNSDVIHPDTMLYESQEAVMTVIHSPSEQAAPSPDEPTEITYRIITKTSNRGNDKLFDNVGFSYCVRKRHRHHTVWKCSKQTKKLSCPARVKQQGGIFLAMGRAHNHPPEVGCDVFKAIKQVAKQKGIEKENRQVSAASIVKETLNGMLPENISMNQADIDCLSRIVNQHRQKSLSVVVNIPFNFEFEASKLPTDFLKKDFIDNKNRFMVFATESNLELLSKAKIWYVDLTSSLISKPFKEMLLIQVFTKANKTFKQIPLVHCIFTRKQSKSDYLKALREVIRLLPRHSAVERIVAKFELHLWRALRQVLPGVEVRGGAYQFQQVVFKQVRSLGLENNYNTDNDTFEYARKLMALCFLPHWHIPAVFCHLMRSAPNEKLVSLSDFVGKTFFENRVWRPSSWSVYGLAFREFDCADLWQIRLGKRHKLPFSDFVSHLYIEANVGKRENVEEEKLKKYQKKYHKLVHSKVYKIWDKYAKGTHAAMKVLKKCAQVYGPVQVKFNHPKNLAIQENDNSVNE